MRRGPRASKNRLLRAAIVGAALLVAPAAAAQDARLQGVFSGSVGVTDNILSTPEEDALGPEADGYSTLSPGLVFRYDTPRTAQTLTYTFVANLFFAHAEANSYTNTAVYSARFVTSPTTDLSLGATAAQGQLNTFIRDTAPGQTPINALPPGGTAFVQGGLNQGFSKQISPVVSMAESLSFLVYEPLQEDPQRTYNLTGTLSGQRLWRHDVGALLLSTAYTHFDNVSVGAPGAEELVGREQLLATLIASWQHDYGRYWSHQLDAGVTQATDVSGGYAQLWQPVGLAAVRYTREEVQAELAYSHAAALNVFLSQLALVDQATLRAAAPLSHAARLGAEGSLGFQLNQPIVEGALGDPTTIFLADAALLWAPIRRVPELELSLRYQHVNQISSAAQIVRNSLLLTATFTYPLSRETESRILMTQPFGGGAQRGRPRAVEPAPEEEEQQEERQGQPVGGGAAE